MQCVQDIWKWRIERDRSLHAFSIPNVTRLFLIVSTVYKYNLVPLGTLLYLKRIVLRSLDLT